MNFETAGYFLVGMFIGFLLWGGEDAFIENVKEDQGSETGESYFLSKVGSGQVAVFHGFVDDYSVCDMARQRIEAEGGVYLCSPASEALENRAGWGVW